MTELTVEQEEALRTTPQRALNQLLFPGPTSDFETSREKFGNLSVLGTIEFLHGIEPGTEYEVEIEAGMRTVMCTLNGQFRPIQVRDTKAKVEVKAAEKADRSDHGQIPAPFAGVVTPVVAEGDVVEVGSVVATIEAMKMEANITTPVAGTIGRLAIGQHQQVEGGDLILVIHP